MQTRTLDDLIAFDARQPRETPLFGQEIFEDAAKAPPLTDPGYRKARAQPAAWLASRRSTGCSPTANVDALVGRPTGGPASIVDPVNGSRFFGSPSTLPAVSGYPHLTVPMGQVDGPAGGPLVHRPGLVGSRACWRSATLSNRRGRRSRGRGSWRRWGRGRHAGTALRPVR